MSNTPPLSLPPVSSLVASDRPSYDYLLGVGPGRSGTTFLHKILTSHTAFHAPEIQDAYYYRSFRRFNRVLRHIRTSVPSAMLVDVANHAYRDPSLAAGLEGLGKHGHRTLLVVLFREHRARAVSMMRFRKSRGHPSALFGAKVLERAVVRHSLTPADLLRLYGLPVDVLTVDFSTLVENTERLLKVLTDICRTPAFGAVPHHPLNKSVHARNLPLAVAGKLAAVVLRRAGFRKTLHGLKEHPRIQRAFFAPLGESPDEVRFSEQAERLLQSCHEACRGVIHTSGTCLAEGIWLKRAGPNSTA